MKLTILAGGFGSRLSEETEKRPKPMVEIGGQPILWHLMKHSAHYGFNEFVVALGYKGEVIKRYFLDYYRFNASMTIDLSDGEVQLYDKESENWKPSQPEFHLNQLFTPYPTKLGPGKTKFC